MLSLITLISTIFILWFIVSTTYPNLLKSPIDVLGYFQGVPPQRILLSVAKTLTNSLIGFFIALILAEISAFLAYLNDFLDSFFTAVNTLVQSVSVLVWALIFIIVFGVLSPIPPILVASASSYPILLSAMLSVTKSLDRKFIEISNTLGASKVQEYIYIILPGSVPHLASAARSAIGIALRISVVAEALGGSGGIGYELMYNYNLGIVEGVLAWAILLILLMIVLDVLILRPIEKWAERWLI